MSWWIKKVLFYKYMNSVNKYMRKTKVNECDNPRKKDLKPIQNPTLL